jgi:hypothetical protein
MEDVRLLKDYIGDFTKIIFSYVGVKNLWDYKHPEPELRGKIRRSQLF